MMRAKIYYTLTSCSALPCSVLLNPTRATPIAPILQKGKLRHGEVK